MRLRPLALLLFFFTVTAFASDLQANHGSVKYHLTVTSGDGSGASIDLDLVLKSGDFTGTASITPRAKLDFGGTVKGYYENGHCVLRVDGPNGRTLELRGDCTTEKYSGYFESHGRGERASGKFNGTGVAAAKVPAAKSEIPLPHGKLTCAYMRREAAGNYQLTFSGMGSITLNTDGSYVTGSGKTGGYIREGDQVKLTSGAWKGYIANVELDRSGQPKLVFHSVDPGATSCTTARK